jgi:hypothetical protein
MEDLIHLLRYMAHREDLPAKWRSFYQRLLKTALNAQDDYEALIQDLQMQLLRNPEFPGDVIGRWLDADEQSNEDDEDDNPAST